MQLAVNGVIIQEQLSASVSERPWVSAHYGWKFEVGQLRCYFVILLTDIRTWLGGHKSS